MTRFSQRDELHLTLEQRAIYNVLSSAEGRGVTVHEIARVVFRLQSWQTLTEGDRDSVRVGIYRLREALGVRRSEVITMRGIGYALRPAEPVVGCEHPASFLARPASAVIA